MQPNAQQRKDQTVESSEIKHGNATDEFELAVMVLLIVTLEQDGDRPRGVRTDRE